MNWLHVTVALVSAIVGGSGVGFWAFMIARRTSSGDIAQTSSEKLWEASNEHALRLSFRIDALEKEIVRQYAEVREAQRRLLECENDRAGLASRLTRIEAETTAAQLIERARVEAAKIRAEAADAKAVVTTAAGAAAEVVTDTATTTAEELVRPPHEGGQ